MLSADGPSKSIPRHELIALALDLGVDRPELLSEAELLQRISRASEASEASEAAESEPAAPVEPQAAPARGWFRVARNLVASMLEKGLNLPSAARVLRDTVRSVPPQRPPYPTVTLAQIYIAQGHTQRAVATLQQVLRRDPQNPKARRLLSTLPAEPEQAVPGLQLERDALVIARKGTKLVLYWELVPTTLARLREPASLELRVSLITPAEEGARVRELTLDVSTQRGSSSAAPGDAESEPSRLREAAVGGGQRALVGHRLLECAPEVVVRAALGDDDGQGFRPLCVASAYRVLDTASLTLEFSPRRTQNDQAAAARSMRWLA